MATLKCLFAALVLSSFCLGQDYPVLRSAHPFPGSRLLLPPNSADSSKRTAVLMLHGSEGGSALLIKPEANILATQGFAVLLLCYFDCQRGLVGTRQTLRQVDTSLVTNAIRWLRQQEWSNGKVAVYGFSRGGELAMIIGALRAAGPDQPSAVIAHSPSDAYISSWNWSWREPACWICTRGSCPGPVPQPGHQWNSACGPDDERRMDFSISAWLIDGQTIPAGRRIEVERIDQPVLITVGEEDQTWPPAQTRRIEAAMRAVGRNPEVHYFPGAGHVFGGDDENRRRTLVLQFLRRLAGAVGEYFLTRANSQQLPAVVSESGAVKQEVIGGSVRLQADGTYIWSTRYRYTEGGRVQENESSGRGRYSQHGENITFSVEVGDDRFEGTLEGDTLTIRTDVIMVYRKIIAQVGNRVAPRATGWE